MAAVTQQRCCHSHTRRPTTRHTAPFHGWLHRPRATVSSLKLQAAETTMQQQTTDLMSIIPWAVQNKLKFAKIKPAVLPGSGRGLVCLADIQPGECVCEVPISAALRVYPGCPAVLGVPSQLFQQLPWYGQLALTLLSEQQQASASKWADYIRTLPAAVDAPVLWTEAEVAELQCPYFIQQVQQQQADWAALLQQVAPYLSAAGLSTQQLYWALSITRSRTFAAPYSSNPFGAQLGWLQKQAGQQQQPPQQQHVMCPLLDLFNHRGDVQSECEFYSDFRSASFRVVASQTWTRGQEVFINYGGGSNDALLQLYGFVELGNKEDRYIVTRLPAVLAEHGLAAGSPAIIAALDEVVLTRQGLDAAAAQQLSQLLSETAPGQAAGESVPYSALGPSVKSVCAAAVQQELSVLAVDTSADQEILQAFDQLPSKQAKLASQQADLVKAQGRLQHLQQLLQESSQQAGAAAAADPGQQQPADGTEQEAAPDAPSEATAELLATLQLCHQLCDRLEAEVAEQHGLIARWQELVQQHKQLAVAFRLEKHLLLTGVLQELQEGGN